MSDRDRLNALRRVDSAQGDRERLEAMRALEGSAAPAREPVGHVEGTMRAALQGATAAWGDEMAAGLHGLFGGDYGEEVGRLRGRMDQYREENPVWSTVAEMIGAVPTAIRTGSMSIAPALKPASGWLTRMVDKSARGPMVKEAMKRPGFLGRVGKGLAGGSAAGGIYGAGQGEGGIEERAESAMVPALFGGGVGGVAPLAGPIGQYLGSHIARLRAGKAGDVPASTVDVLQEVFDVDTGYGARLPQLQQGQLLADTGPASRATLDLSMQRSGDAAAAGRRAVSQRAEDAAASLRHALNDALGDPKGLKVVEDRMRGRGDPLDAVFGTGGAGDDIGRLYDEAYGTPIDYSTGTGDELVRLIRERVPPKAVRAANQLMRLNEEKSAQRMINLDADGRLIDIETLPDVRQIDYITRGLNQLAEREKGKGAMGRTTPLGRGYSQLSTRIRSLLRDAAPAYDRAVSTAAEPIRARQAMQTGRQFFRMTRDDLRDELSGATPMERQFVAQGMREAIDDAMAGAKESYLPSPTVTGYVSRTASKDTEGDLVLRELSSRASRDKIQMVIGDGPATRLFDELERVNAARELRDTMLLNLRKYAAQERDKRIRERDAGPLAQLREGNPLAAGGALWKALTGQTDDVGADRLDAALVNTLLRQGDNERIMALLASPRPRQAGAQAARRAEILFGRAPLAAIPAVQQ